MLHTVILWHHSDFRRNSVVKKVKIFEGQMKRPTFRIKFKGNNPNYGANIAYYYNGK